MGRLFSKGKVNRETTLMASKYFDNYNQHTHIGNLGAPTAPTDKQDTGA